MPTAATTLALYLQVRGAFVADLPTPDLEHLERWISPRTRSSASSRLGEQRIRRVLAASLAAPSASTVVPCALAPSSAKVARRMRAARD
jgi:hypothetical protein